MIADNTTADSGLRELTVNEIDVVSGGVVPPSTTGHGPWAGPSWAGPVLIRLLLWALL